jgi:deoxyadenosine/deoxycytidine kinase
MLISIEGNIGTGKTTLINILKNKFSKKNNVIFVEEPLNQWLSLKDSDGKNILGKFYEDQERWSYSFQMHAFITRSKDILKQNTNDNVVIIERSVLTDCNVFANLLHESGKISEMEWKLYVEWFDWLTEQFSKVIPDKFIYLKAEPEVSYQRMINRTRDEENNVPIEYLQSVSEKHDDWLLDESMENVITIDVNQDFSDSDRFKETVIDRVSQLIKDNVSSMSSSSSEKSFDEMLSAMHC